MSEQSNNKRKWPAISLDMETGAVEEDGALLEVGAVAFDPDTGETGPKLWLLVDWESNDAAWRRFSGATLAWWARRWRAGLSPVPDPTGTVELPEAVRTARQFILDHLADAGELWTKGNMDLPLLAHAMKGQGLPVPWQYWQANDLRTVLKWEKLQVDKSRISHTALNDAWDQAILLIGMRAERGRK